MYRLLLFTTELVSLGSLELLLEFKLEVTDVFLVESSLLTGVGVVTSTTWLLKKMVRFQVTKLLKARKQMMHLTTFLW